MMRTPSSHTFGKLTGLSAGLALLCLLFTPALAQKKPTKGNELETNEKAAKNTVKPENDVNEDIVPDDEAQAKRIAAKEKKLSTVRQRQIKQMRGILKKNPLYKKKADLLFRIAEKEWDEAKYRYFLERRKYEKQMDAFFNNTLKKRPEEPEPDYSKAIVEYKKLLKEFPNYKRLDEVMYYLGRGLLTAGKKKEGASYMLRLTKDFPNSKYVTPAYLQVAEYYFDNDLLFAAKTNYLKVADNKKASEYPYALYKLGYVYFNLKEFRDSINSFKEVVKLSQGKDKRKIYFTNQAFDGLCMNFAEVDEGWKEARDYFKGVGDKKLVSDRLEKIARLYNKQDKINDEIAVYEYLIGAEKQGKKVPEYAEYITAAYKKLENIEDIDKVINRFLGTFDTKSSWYVTNKDNAEAMTRANQYREGELVWITDWYHTKAQENEDKLKKFDVADKYYRKAAVYYEKYLNEFPEAKDVYEREFFLAEIYFYQTNEWDKAIDHYTKVVKKDAKGKYSIDAAYAVILAAEEKMAVAGLIPPPGHAKDAKASKKKAKTQGAQIEYTKQDKSDKEFKPIPKTELHATEEDFVKACETYVDTYPKDKEVPGVSFRAAEIYIKKGHYAEGVKRLEVIMEYHPKHRFAGYAAATLFDSNYRLRRWDQMERWARYMLDRKNYKVLKKKQLLDVIAVSINEYAQQLSKEGKKDDAVKEMLRFVNEFPKHEKASIALFNAAVLTEEAEKTEQAVDLYERIIKKYPKTVQATESHFVLGALYESQTEFNKAAEYFEKMASFPIDDDDENAASAKEKMADSLYNAGAIRAALQDYPQAISALTKFVNKFPEKKETPEVYLEIARLYEEKGDLKNAKKTYNTYLKKFSKTNAEMVPDLYVRLAKLEQKKGGKRARRNTSKLLTKALKAYKRLDDETKAKPVVKHAGAEARFMEVEYVLQDFNNVKLEFPVSKLRRALVKKGKLLNECEKGYLEVLEFSDHQISAGAVFRIGEMYQEFAQGMKDLPIPEGLSEDEIFTYEALLDETIQPLEEKGIEAARRALALAHNNNVYNKWSRRSSKLLVRLSPELFPVLGDNTNETHHTVAATFSTSFITDPAGKLEQMIEKKAPAPKPAAPKAGDKAGAPGDKAAPEGGKKAPEAGEAAGKGAEQAAAPAAKEGK